MLLMFVSIPWSKSMLYYHLASILVILNLDQNLTLWRWVFSEIVDILSTC